MASLNAFERWYATLKPWEGSVADWEAVPANLKYDKGGLTNWGVTIGTWNTLAPIYGWTPGEQGLRAMTAGQHKQIAFDQYWKASSAPSLPDGVAIFHADTGWGLGVGTAAKILQRALNDVGQSVVVDGVIGPATLAAVKRVSSQDLLAAYLVRRKEYYTKIIAYDPDQEVFWQGWINRITDIFSISLSEIEKKNPNGYPS